MVSLKEAWAKRDELAMMVFDGESPLRQKQLEKLAVANTSTVQDFYERYFKEVIQKDRKDPTQLRRYLDNEIYPAFGSRSHESFQSSKTKLFLMRLTCSVVQSSFSGLEVKHGVEDYTWQGNPLPERSAVCSETSFSTAKAQT